MKLPQPEVGQVIRYRYLWNRESAAGHEDGRKDRPCAVVVALPSTPPDSEGPTVAVVPITHSPPDKRTFALEIPRAVKRRLGLDDQPSWIVLDELNRFIWPGPDLMPARASREALEMIYGSLPKQLTDQALAILTAAIREGKLRVVKRTE